MSGVKVVTVSTSGTLATGLMTAGLAAGGVVTAGVLVAIIASEVQKQIVRKKNYHRLKRYGSKWMHQCQDLQLASQEQIQTTKNRFNALINEADQAFARPDLTTANLVDLQSKLEAEANFLNQNLKERMAKAEEERRDICLIKQKRQLASAVLENNKSALPLKIAESLTTSKNSSDPEEIETAIRQALNWLDSQPAIVELSEEELSILQALQGDAPTPSADVWRAPPSKDEARLIRLAERLTALEFAAPEAAEIFQERLNLIWCKKNLDYGRRAMLIDSLTIELAEKTQAIREFEGILEQLENFEEENGALAEALGEPAEPPAAASKNFDITNLPFIKNELVKAENRFKDLQGRLESRNARLAFLESLAELGYEVHASMEGLWLEEGQLVLRNAASPGYGLEIGGSVEKKLQIRPVSFSDMPDPARDRDIENIWHGEFKTFAKKMVTRGVTVNIENMVEPGLAPLKRMVQKLQTPLIRNKVLKHP